MSKHIDTRNKIKGIASVSSFTSLLESATLSAEDRLIMKLHYLDSKDFQFIADTLGYSESTIKKRHKKILAKISRLI